MSDCDEGDREGGEAYARLEPCGVTCCHDGRGRNVCDKRRAHAGPHLCGLCRPSPEPPTPELNPDGTCRVHDFRHAPAAPGSELGPTWHEYHNARCLACDTRRYVPSYNRDEADEMQGIVGQLEYVLRRDAGLTIKAGYVSDQDIDSAPDGKVAWEAEDGPTMYVELRLDIKQARRLWALVRPRRPPTRVA